ncbi:MAG: hypothetical protein A3A51_00720 [Candidatus Levybacteria bacterium RIFCSPLOWO2_01_FULL_39_10]|nr:MAG: hypothetical protein A3A51_00720 [Candidatus Levybacteria bacterium RIFCSPLOWO2_01_FULL_39_10]
MEKFDRKFLKQLYIPAPNSTKGENGKVLVIGGSHLFHSSAFWALEIASRIVDMAYFSSTPMNNEIVKKLKTKFLNGIVVPRDKIEDYIEEADSVLIGPGLPRPTGEETGDDDTKILTERLLTKFPDKKWVIDGGSLQVIEPEIVPKTAIITPNKKEFKMLLDLEPNPENATDMAKKYGITILLKGPVDIVCEPFDSAQAVRGSEEPSGSRRGEIRSMQILGGNAGMTKGGTGDTLAGLVVALYAKNGAFLSASSGSFINKKAGESLFRKVGLYFNASDLVDEIPIVMRDLI